MGGGADGASHKGSVAKVNGNRNVPYLNEDDSKRNLNLNWWNDDWNPDYRFLAVRHFHVSPALIGGSFVLQLLTPSAKHSAYFREIFREISIFFRIKSPHFPRELNEQLQKVNARDTSIDEDDFFRMCAVASEEAILDCMKEYVVYLRA